MTSGRVSDTLTDLENRSIVAHMMTDYMVGGNMKLIKLMLSASPQLPLGLMSGDRPITDVENRPNHYRT